MKTPELVSGRFEIERLASSGGMAVVYRALDRTTGLPVALKVLHADGVRFAGHFARESYVLAELDHPGIVRYIAHGSLPSGELFLAMEWLEGEDVAQRCKRGPLSVADTVTLAMRVAQALGAAHARGVVHRDIKPGNLYLPDRDITKVKILDFGIARPQATRPATRTGILLGTPGYMAPEQIIGAPTIDPRADVFALGCVLYECLTGRPAFEAEQMMVLLSKMRAPEPPRPLDVRHDVPVALDEIISRMLSSEPAHRPQDGAAVAAEIAMLDDAETPWVQGGAPFDISDEISIIEDPFEVTNVDGLSENELLKTLPLGTTNLTMPLDHWYRAQLQTGPRTQELPTNIAVSVPEKMVAPVPEPFRGLDTKCVGRERETKEIIQSISTAALANKPASLVIVGKSGIGKTTLLAEVVRNIDERGGIVDAQGIVRPVTIFAAASDPHARAASLGLVAEIIRNAANIRCGDEPAVQRDKLLQHLARYLDEKHAVRIVEFLGELADIPFPDDLSVPLRAARQDARLMGDQLRRAFEDWLGAECAVRPVLIIIDDLEWMDQASAALLEGALTSIGNRPLFVLATDEEPRRFAAGARGRAYPLTPVAPETTEGLSRLLQDKKLIRNALGTMSEGAQRMLSVASIFGRIFWQNPLFSMVGASGKNAGADAWQNERQALTELSAAGWIVRRGIRTPWGEEFAVAHALVRDVAQGMLEESERKRLHVRLSEWLERMGGTESAVLAEHLYLGGADERAVPWAALAAERAFEAGDFDAVRAWVSRGIAAAPAGEVRGTLRLFESQACKYRGDHRGALESGRDAMKFLPRGSPLWYSAAGEVALAAGNLGDDAALLSIFEALTALGMQEETGGPHVIAVARVALQLLMAGHFDHVEAMFAALDDLERRTIAVDPEVLASVHRARALRALFNGDAGTSVSEFEAAAKRFEEVGDFRNACVQRINVGSCTNELGDWARSESALREALASAERMGLGPLVAQAKLNLGLALARRGQLSEALNVERDALTMYARQGLRRLEGGARMYLGMIRLAAGNVEAAEREVNAALELLVNHPPVRAHAFAVLAQIALVRGDARAALGPAGEAMKILDSVGGIEEGESLVRLVWAEALASAGPEIEARTAIAQAYQRLVERGEKIRDGSWRKWFLEVVPENVRTRELAVAWGATRGG
ncbi:MAG TPA: protein kinase [Polyangium sp.]|nr:protein kinase [Polyangium sp.]